MIKKVSLLHFLQNMITFFAHLIWSTRTLLDENKIVMLDEI